MDTGRKKIIIARSSGTAACGSGFATANTLAEKVKDICLELKLNTEVIIIDSKALRNQLSTAHCFIALPPFDKADYGIPVLNGLPFLTGMGLDKAIEDLAKIVRS